MNKCLFNEHVGKFDKVRHLQKCYRMKLISFSAKTFKKIIYKNFGEFIEQSYDHPPFILSPLLCMLKHHFAPRNKITSGNISKQTLNSPSFEC